MTSTITAVFSAFSFFGLAIVSVWFASERTIFSRHKGRKWLSDALDDVSIPGYKRVKKIALDLIQSAHEGGCYSGAGGRPADASTLASPTIQPSSSPEPGPEISSTRDRFRNREYSLVRVNKLIELGDEVKAKVLTSLNDCKVPNTKPVEAVVKPRNSRVAGLVSKLQNMVPTQSIAAHRALVRHMQVRV